MDKMHGMFFGICYVKQLYVFMFLCFWECSSICIREITNWIPICAIFYTEIAIRIWGSVYAYGGGLLKKMHIGIPFCIQKLSTYSD
jgi:hypothetical protein